MPDDLEMNYYFEILRISWKWTQLQSCSSS